MSFRRVGRRLWRSVVWGVGCAMLFVAAGCATHPLGMSDEEWNRLTPQQQLEASKEEARNELEREKLRQAEQQRREAEELARDKAAGMIYEYRPDAPYCMGGDRCPRGSFDELILSMGRLADVDRILFYADDGIGNKHDGVVAVYADDVRVGQNIAIDRFGTWYQVLIARPARNITLRAVTDDEVEVGRVKVYGSWAAGKQQYLIVK